jgi:hypothetical protein
MRAAAIGPVLGALLAALVLVVSAAAANPKDPQQRHTAADTRLAKSIALTLVDLAAGWHANKSTTAGNDPSCKSQPDESALVQTALIDPSFTYQDGITTIGSQVDVFRSAREARLDWRLSTISALKDCFASALALGAKLPVTVSSFKSLPIAKLSERTLHYRIAMVVHAAQPLTFVAELVAIGKGRVTTVFHAVTLSKPVPASLTLYLARILAGRLNSAGRTA